MVSNPIEGYDSFTVGDVEDAIDQYENGLSALDESALRERRSTVSDVLQYEKDNKDRVTAKEAIRDVLDSIDEQFDDPPVSSEDDSEDDADDDSADTESDSQEDEEEVDETEEEDEPEVEEVEPDVETSIEDAAFSGGDGSTRILVRNANKDSRRIAGIGLDGGEVKDVVLNDRIREALERGRLQYVGDA